jgi:diguanylate cyclase (GGDEF)-like protein
VRDYTGTFARQLTNVPLKTGSGVIGAIALDGLPRNDRDRRLLRALADLAAVALEKAELLEETRRRVNQLRALRQAGQAMTSDLHLEVVLQTLTETVRHLIGARYAALAVLDVEGTRSVAQFHTAGLSEAERQRIGDPPQGRGLLGAVLREGVPIRLDDMAHDPRSVGFPPHHPPMKTFMGMPLVARGKVIGSLYLTDKVNDQSFTRDDEALVMGLAADAAIAIENARLFGAVQQLAVTDSLTGLHNRRHFFELAEHEFQRARRYRRTVSMIMLDIDRFKRVNDAYGHAAGDQVLQALAARCRETLRDIDFMGRYGGEEFVVLLPENDVGGARSAAERLRQCVAEPPIETYRGPVSVTISLGVAAMTEDCPDVVALLDRADAAMYAAKEAGRNRVEEMKA